MKNFFKKLSFVLAIAMVLTSIAPATASAAVSEKNVPVKKVNVKYDGEKVDSINLDVEETKTIKLGLPVTKAAKAAGFTKTTFATAVKVADDSVVEVVKVSKRLYEITGVAAGETTITFGAAKTKKLAKAGEFKKEATLTVVVEAPAAELTAKQTATNKITVTGADLSATASDYVIKRGTTVITMANVELNDAKTEAVLTAGASSLAAGNYSATVGEKTVEFVVETSRIDSIEIIGDYLILTDDYPHAVGYVPYAVFNQFGENITKKTSNMNANSTFGSRADAQPSDGIILVTDISESYVLGATGTVVVVNTETGKSANKTITLGNAGKASAFEVLGLYNMATGKPMTITESANVKINANAAVLVKVTNQYGYPMNAIDSTQVAVNFAAGLTKLNVTTGTTYTFDEVVTVDGVDYVAIPVTVPADVKAGDASLILVSKTNGSTATGTISVTNATSVHDFSVYTLDTVYNAEDVEFGYTALAADGTEIKDYATLSNPNYGVKLPNNKWRWALNSDGTAKLVYHASFTGLDEDNKYTSDSASFEVPSSYKYTTVTFNVYEQSRPASIGGVYTPAQNPTFGKNLGVLNNESVEIGVQNVIIYDQYGREINPYFVSNHVGYQVLVTSADSNSELIAVTGSALALDDTDAKVKFDAAAELGKVIANKYELTLMYGGEEITGSDYDITVTAAEMNNIASFELSLDSKTLYTENADTGLSELSPYYNYDTMGIKVTGTATNGKAVTIPSAYFTAYGTIVTGSALGWTMQPSVMSAYLEANKLTELDMAVRVVIDNAEGTELKETVTVSNAKPSVIMAFQGSTAGVAKEPVAATLSADTLLATVSVADQYMYWGGYAMNTITNIKVVDFTSNTGSVTKNNSKAPEFTGFVAGDKMIVTYTFSSGVTTTIAYTLQ